MYHIYRLLISLAVFLAAFSARAEYGGPVPGVIGGGAPIGPTCSSPQECVVAACNAECTESYAAARAEQGRLLSQQMMLASLGQQQGGTAPGAAPANCIPGTGLDTQGQPSAACAAGGVSINTTGYGSLGSATANTAPAEGEGSWRGKHPEQCVPACTTFNYVKLGMGPDGGAAAQARTQQNIQLIQMFMGGGQEPPPVQGNFGEIYNNDNYDPGFNLNTTDNSSGDNNQ